MNVCYLANYFKWKIELREMENESIQMSSEETRSQKLGGHLASLPKYIYVKVPIQTI